MPGGGAPVSGKDGAACGSPLLLARQPVFDVAGAVWGYELLFRQPEFPDHCGPGTNASVVTAAVMADGFAMVRPTLAPGQRLLVNFAEDMLLTDARRILPADICGVEVLETVPASGAVLLAVAALKAEGCLIVVDDYTGQPGVDALLDLADIVKIDVLGRSRADLARDVQHLRTRNCLLLAEKVEDTNTRLQCVELGFSLFQGFFFSRPDLMHSRRLDSSQAARVRLLATLAHEDASIKAATEVVRSDAALSHKLLRYINSLYFGIPVRVTSIQHGIALLGTRNLVQWLCVTVLSEFDTGPMARELITVSALRARFLELCASRAAVHAGPPLSAPSSPHGSAPVSHPPGMLFMLGLFLLLEALLCLPAADLLRTLPLMDDLGEALSTRTGPYSPWLTLVEDYERGRWEDVAAHASAMGLTRSDLAKAYVGALEWSTFFHHGLE